MQNFLIGAMDGGAGAELQEAAGVGGNDGLGACGLSVAHFFCEEFERSFRLRDIVDSGGAAANFRVGQFHKIETRNGAQKLAWSFANFLSVEEMARILIGDAEWKRVQFCGEAESGEKFGDVASLCGQSAGLAVLGLVR